MTLRFLCLLSAKRPESCRYYAVPACIWVCLYDEMLNCSHWGKMIQPRKTSPEVVRRFWANFWGQTHLIWRGIHSQNMFSISCLDVFENSNFDFFLNSLCRSRLNLNPWMSPLDTQANFWAKFRYVSLRIFWPKIATYSQKKVFENFVNGYEQSVHTRFF